MALTTIGATDNASGRQVTFDQIASAYTQVVKLAAGAEGVQALVEDAAPLPAKVRAKMASAIPAAGSAGSYTDWLMDLFGRGVVVEDAPDEEKGSFSYESAATSYTILTATANYTAKVRALTVRNLNTRKSVVVTVMGGASTLLTAMICPGDFYTLPDGMFLKHGTANENVIVASSDGTVKLSVQGSYVKARA